MEAIEKILKLIDQEKRNFIFYFDDDGSFKEELPAIEQAGVRLIEVGQNFIELKYRLEFELHDQPVFLYHPHKKPSPAELKKYPLLDLLMANMELRLDDASEFLSEYRLQEDHLPLVKRYIKHLKVKSNLKKLAGILDRVHFTEENLKWGLISIALEFNTLADRNQCVAKWLSLATDDAAFNKANKFIKSHDLDSNLLGWINHLTEVNGRSLNRELAEVCACKIKYNMLTLFIDRPHMDDNYSKLKMDRPGDLNRLQAFFNEWSANPQLKKHIEPVFETLGRDVKSATVLRIYGASQEYGYHPSEMVVSMIKELYRHVEKNPLKVQEDCQKWLSSAALSDDQRLQVSFVFHASAMLAMLESYSSFRFNKAEDYIREYTTGLYKIDLHFRKAVLAYEQSSGQLFEFDDAAGSLFSHLNQRYDDYLKGLNVEWQQLLDELNFDYNRLPVGKQYDFYRDNLQDFEYKIVVVISDAFRYELGVELYQELVADNKNLVTIEPVIASVPSYTNLGMANLLPHDKITVEKGETDLVFKINDIPTTSHRRRDILQATVTNSETITFTNVMKLNQEDGRKFFSDNRIVYVYHDWIDAIGDKRKTEYQTFEATAKAQEDIIRLTKKLFGFNVYHVLVTADHGFLFNHTTLKETAREDMPKPFGYQLQQTRFVISDDFEGKVNGYTLSLCNTTNIKTDLKVVIPRAVNRYHKQGNIGLQFTHGGASLQELLTPVIKIHRKKKEFGQSVSFKRIDENKKITSGSIKITLLQDQPVSNEHKSREIILGLYSDTGALFSGEITVTLNSTSQSPKERIFEPILSLNSTGSRANFCYLKAFDKNDKQRLNPIGINDLLQISSLMEKDEF